MRPDENLKKPGLLSKEHELAGFDCGKAPLNEFLLKHALQNQSGGATRTFVLTRGKQVIAYYSLAPASVSPETAPERVMKGQAKYPVPVILMARFAVDSSEQGRGYGKALLRDALLRALAGSEAIGGRAFLVHAKDEEARNFYLKFGMEPSPTNPFHLFFLFKDIRQTLSAESEKRT